jgi:hypothetical protein
MSVSGHKPTSAGYLITNRMRSVGRDPATYRSIKRMRQHPGLFSSRFAHI